MAHIIMDDVQDTEDADNTVPAEDWYARVEDELLAESGEPTLPTPCMYLPFDDNVFETDRCAVFQPILDVFSLGSLLIEHQHICSLASGLSNGSMPVPSKMLEQFLSSYGADDRTGVQFALQLAQMWPCHSIQRASVELFDLTIAMERRDIMLASAVAWYWLTQECASAILLYASELEEDSSALDGADLWLSQLTRDVYLKLRWHEPDRLIHPSNYFPNCPSSMKAAYITRQGHDCDPIAVCVQVITLLRKWLGFPTTSELLSAYFVLHLVDICGGNLDILLLRGVWRPYKEIKAAVLDMRRQRWSSLRLSDLVPFTEALHDLPLSCELSTERGVLDQITVAIQGCAPHIPNFSDVSSAMRRMPGPYPLPNNNIPATSMCSHFHRSSPKPSSPSRIIDLLPTLSPALTPPSDQLDKQRGLDAIVEFFQDLLPLVRGEGPTSVIQQLVASDVDRFLPFRNLAPTRSAVTGPDGPFHPANVCKPGAFASCVINRALTFNTPAAKDNGNPTLFSNEGEWDAFKEARNFVKDDPQSLAYFFNMTCYGTAQGTRYGGMRDIDVYFAAEEVWKKLLAECQGKVPFARFFRWAKQQVKRADKRSTLKHPLGPRLQSRLPQVGKLTAFLLAADLSYSGVVESPSAEEVGVVIHKNGLGSLMGLVETGQIISKDASQEEVVGAFQNLLNYLQETIAQEDQDLVGLDAIMVEHLLCKFQRVHGQLPSFKGKGK